jgi:hypothetical protein
MDQPRTPAKLPRSLPNNVGDGGADYRVLFSTAFRCGSQEGSPPRREALETTEANRQQRPPSSGWREYEEIDCRHWDEMPTVGDDVPYWGWC